MITPKHVLILEDDDQLSRLYEKVLQHARFRTLRLAKVETAIQHLLRFDPDVVLLDWQLADGNSAPILETLISYPHETLPKIALVTGERHRYEAIQQYAGLIQTTLIKPVTIQELLQKVHLLAALSNQRHYYQQITYTQVNESHLLMDWVGNITADHWTKTFSSELTTIQTLIWDIRKLNPYRFRLDQFPPALPLPVLKEIYLFHHQEDQMLAQYLYHWLNGNVPVYYNTSWEGL